MIPKVARAFNPRGHLGPVDPATLADAITARIEADGGTWHGGQLTFRCPAPDHEDRNPSASWKPNGGKDGRGVWCCHSRHCEAQHGGGSLALAALLGIDVDPYRTASASPKGLSGAPERRNGSAPAKGQGQARNAPAPAVAAQAAAPATLADFERSRGLPPGYLARVWQVTEGNRYGRPCLAWPSAQGLPARLRFLDGKGQDGKQPKYGWATVGGRAHLYGLPLALERLAADPSAPLYVVNGEPSTWAAAAAGLAAVCFGVGEGSGAAKLAPQLAEALAGIGRPVAVRVAFDADDAGRKGGPAAAADLAAAGLDAAALDLAAWPGWQDAGGMPDRADVGDLAQAAGPDGLAAALANLPPLRDSQTPAPEPPASSSKADGGGKDKAPRFPVPVCLADVEELPVEWLWEPYIPRGAITLVSGDPSVGKSTLCMAIAAAVTRGQGLPGVGPTEPGRVLYLTAEDDLARTVRPRLRVAGADLSAMIATDAAVPLTDPAGQAWMIETARAVRPDLIVIDTLSAFFGANGDFHKANEARAFSAPLAHMAGELNAAVLVISHGSKAAGRKVIHASQGSVDFVAAARAALLVGVDPKDKNRRAVIHTKASLGDYGPSLGYAIGPDPDNPKLPRLTWTGETDLTAGDVQASDYQVSDEPGNLTREDAETHILNALAEGGGEAWGKDIEADWKAQGGSKRTLERGYAALRETAGLRHRREGAKDGGRGSAGVVYYRDHAGHASTPPTASTPPSDAFIVGGGVNATPPETLTQQGFSTPPINSAANYEKDNWRSDGHLAELTPAALVAGEF